MTSSDPADQSLNPADQRRIAYSATMHGIQLQRAIAPAIERLDRLAALLEQLIAARGDASANVPDMLPKQE